MLFPVERDLSVIPWVALAALGYVALIWPIARLSSKQKDSDEGRGS
jgi:hypothetical protein